MSEDRSLASLLSGVRLGQFISVGIVGATLDTSVTLLLKELLVVHPDLAKFVGAECAIVVMFALNDRWTFAAAGRAGLLPLGRRLLTSNLVRSAGVGVQLIVFTTVRRLDVSIVLLNLELWKVLPILIAIGTASIVNYLAESLLTWRVHRG